MEVYIDVLGLSLEDWVPSEVNTAHVVAIEEKRILDGNAQILKHPFQPNGFTRGDYHAPVFSLCARQCNCRLVFVAPRYSSIAEREDKTRR
mgnify:CR=1 FL=1